MRRQRLHRRDLLGLAASLGLAAPRPAIAADTGRADNPSHLRFVPQSNLATPDPVWNITPVTRNHGLMVWDTLYGWDAQFVPRPQMVGAHDLSPDGLTWTFALRDGLLFHDGTPVAAADCVASIRRWAARRPLGQRLLSLATGIDAVDARTFRILLKQPFAQMTYALSEFCFVMPERIARTDPFTRITDYIGSGPYRFLAGEWIAGASAAYARFDHYRPRDEPPSFLAGGKVAHFDRVDWRVMPDAATAVAALQNDEVDWLEQPGFDLVPLLRRTAGVRVLANDPIGVMAMLALNHLHPPFDNQKLRRAVLSAIDQADFMAAAVGDDPHASHVPIGFFTPGLGSASDAGMTALTAPRDLARSRALVADSGYRGERTVVMAAVDNPVIQATAQLAADLFRRLGLAVDLQSMDLGTLVQRRASKAPTDQGGWSAFTTTYEGLTMANPATNVGLRGNGDGAWFGWPTSLTLESLRIRWLDTSNPAAQHAIAEQIQVQAFTDVPFIPLGQIFYPTATRTSVTDVIAAPFPVFWGVRKGMV